jgi:hypothetical protein
MMKIAPLFTLVLFLYGISAPAQVAVNIGSPPSWGPVGYANDVQYYYLPDIESYYDLRSHQFIYLNEGGWVRSGRLPKQYRNYNLYSGYKVVLVDYRGPNPYAFYKTDRVKYYKGYREGPQRSYGYKVHREKGHVFAKENGNREHEGREGQKGNNGRGNRDKQ